MDLSLSVSLALFLSFSLPLSLSCHKLHRLPSIGKENSPNTQQDSNPPLDFFAFDLSLSYSCCFTPEATAFLMLRADLETILFISNVFRFLTSNRSNQKEGNVPLQEKSCRYFFPLIKADVCHISSTLSFLKLLCDEALKIC